MEHTDQEYVLKMAKDNNVKFIRLWFTDILGFLKSFAITPAELSATSLVVTLAPPDFVSAISRRL